LSAPDVVVIGGGLHGCSTALHLARHGARVLVLEKDHVGRHASGVNAGGVRRLGRHLAEIPIAVASMEMWHRIGELVDDDCGFAAHGQVKVAENEAELEACRERVRQVRALGFDHEELIDRDELREWVPAIAGHCVGGILCRRDGAALPYRTTQAFRRKGESLGVRFAEGVRVTGLVPEGGAWRIDTDRGPHRVARVVNAAGAWGGRIAEALGEPVPLEAIALMLMITEPVAPFLEPVVGAAGRTLSFKQFANGTVLIGGGHRGRADPETNRTDLDFARLAVNARTAFDLFPGMRRVQIVRAWAGIEGRMADDIPVIGPSARHPGVWHQFGFSAHGFQMAPAVGAIVAELVTQGRTAFPVAPFAIGRFATAPAAAAA
jgi:sarcosine oxidase subunit beta